MSQLSSLRSKNVHLSRVLLLVGADGPVGGDTGQFSSDSVQSSIPDSSISFLTVLGACSASIRIHNYSDGSVLLVVGMETVQRFRNTTHQTDSLGQKHVELNYCLITLNLKPLPQSFAFISCMRIT